MSLSLPDWRGARILVLGDLILDRFIYGQVHRISPEAPIPVVEVTGEHLVPGGAANVARNILALGGTPIMLGVTGNDANRNLLLDVLAGEGLETAGVLSCQGRVTTVKTRVIAHQQQVVRVDREVKAPVPEATRKELAERLQAELPSCRAVVVSDYAKGVLTPAFLKTVGEFARQFSIPYVVDPKPVHFPYPDARVVTPNRDETAGFIGRPFRSEDLDAVAAELFTLGAEGMALAERAGGLSRIPSRVREVFDVTGAGDTVVAVVALGLGAGLPLADAARLANQAAGIVVGKVGTAVCKPEELEAALSESA
jgi:rfaE bifunctional protein kinase chain/domain